MTLPGQLGGLREQLIGTDPSAMVRELTAKDYHRRNFPTDSVDKAPTTAPLGPVARATTKSHQLELFMCSADFASTQDQIGQNRSRGALPAGTRHLFRASFQPDYWQLYTFKVATGTVGDLLYYSVMSDVPSLPADVLIVTADLSAIATIPGRGDSLGIWTPSTNAGSVSLVARAVSALVNGVSGSVDE